MADKKQTMLYGLLTSIASKITYDNTTSLLEADNVQDAIDILATTGESYLSTERVVGKDYDGNTIYEKSYKSSTYTSGDSGSRRGIVFALDTIDDAAALISFDGYYTITSNGNTYKRPANFTSAATDKTIGWTSFAQFAVIDGHTILQYIIQTSTTENITSATVVIKARHSKAS